MNMKIKGKRRKFFEEKKSFIFPLKTILMMGKFSFCSMSHSTALLPSKFINDFCLLFFPIFFFAPSPISILARNLENKSRTINFEGKRSWKVLRLSSPHFARVLNARILAWDRKTFHFPTFFFFEKSFSLICFFSLCCKKSYKNFFFFKNFVLFRRKNKKTLFLF